MVHIKIYLKKNTPKQSKANQPTNQTNKPEMEVNKSLKLAHFFYVGSFQCGRESSQVFNTKSWLSFIFFNALFCCV